MYSSKCFCQIVWQWYIACPHIIGVIILCEITWCYLVPRDITRCHQTSPDLTRHYPMSTVITWRYYISPIVNKLKMLSVPASERVGMCIRACVRVCVYVCVHMWLPMWCFVCLCAYNLCLCRSSARVCVRAWVRSIYTSHNHVCCECFEQICCKSKSKQVIVVPW